jgi:hypothetical protein
MSLRIIGAMTIEQQLGPQLNSGDVVILDNLSAYKALSVISALILPEFGFSTAATGYSNHRTALESCPLNRSHGCPLNTLRELVG